jgi:predicted nucleic acid-binding protein
MRQADEAFDILLSPAILEDYQKTCDRLVETHPNLAYQRLLLDLTRHGVFVPDSPPEHAITQDHDDDKFLQCAREAGAHSVISGDCHLLAVTPRISDALVPSQAGEVRCCRSSATMD